ncbi:uncharacterized protein LOC123557565 [Mercenaria mercenaria]|uniref:uncharacterized protein LOC123557565 n=1 Tax=Mercenaria mercenaria TaxID=6596 RepID=UPI00234F068A|nr:uncharacterized protein LOC123557565 [Mercenaria mercenaria]
MKVLYSVLAAVYLLGFSDVSANEKFHVEAIKEGEEDIVSVTDENGKVVSTAAFHPEDEYQLQKPNDENDYVCLVSHIEENENGNEQCYERVPLPEDLEHGLELEECEDREIFLLKPMDPKDCENDSLVSRRGHSYCIWIAQVQCYCAERYCAKRGWWGKCGRWGCRRYAYRVLKTKKCY